MILLTPISGNRKTGPIPVSTSSKETCPDACPFKSSGCYAKTGVLNIHWNRVTKGIAGLYWPEFIKEIMRLPTGQLWRHNQAGDLEGHNNSIDAVKLNQLVEANNYRPNIAYTHKPVLKGQASPNIIKNNVKAIKNANSKGFTINLSGNNLAHADRLLRLKIAPVVTVLPSTQLTNLLTPAGNRVIVCPATTHENVTCNSCRLCSRKNRDYIIGFPAHGNAKNRVTQIANAA